MNFFGGRINRFIHLSFYPKTVEIFSLIRAVLQTSEGFPSQVSKARIKDGELSPGKVGHAKDSHLRTDGPRGKTRFKSNEDTEEALRQLLNTGAGQIMLGDAYSNPGKRVRCDADIELFDIIKIDKSGAKSVISAQQQQSEGQAHTRCHLEFEVRERNGISYAHVQTFFPRYKE
jgi:hypothetical protein